MKKFPQVFITKRGGKEGKSGLKKPEYLDWFLNNKPKFFKIIDGLWIFLEFPYSPLEKI